MERARTLCVLLALSFVFVNAREGEFSSNVYVRWGRTVCTAGDTLIYIGHGASSHYQQDGSGANVLCLTSDPSTNHTSGNHGAGLYAVQYRTHDFGVPELEHLEQKKMPCVVCKTELPTFMQPANVDCPSGFTTLYSGWLMSAYYNKQQVNFICVDGAAEGMDIGETSSFAFLYPVEAQDLSQYIDHLEVMCSVCTSKENTGSTYIRWGRTTCNSDSTEYSVELYKGTVAGGYYNHAGGGANLLCFPDNPTFPVNASSADENGGLLYPYEYQVSSYGDILWDPLHDADVPCIVCQTLDRPAVFTLYGRTDCPMNFNRDYDGIMMSGKNSHYRKEHICVDKQAEGVEPKTSQDLGMLYRVEIASPEPEGYTLYREVTCAQCSSGSASNKYPTYTIWGKTSCPSSSTTVYEGIMGASHYNQHGGGHNYLCLHNSPQMTGSSLNTGNNLLYQVEYQTTVFDVDEFTIFDFEVPCAVCQTQFKPSLFMLPGSYSCPSEWDVEYSGYLMASHRDHKGKSEYICVAENAEAIGSPVDNNGGLIYDTAAEGSLADGYDTGYEVLCAICSQSEPETDESSFTPPETDKSNPTPPAETDKSSITSPAEIDKSSVTPPATSPESPPVSPRDCGSCAYEQEAGPPGGCNDVETMKCVCLDTWDGLFSDCCFHHWREACVALAVGNCGCLEVSSVPAPM